MAFWKSQSQPPPPQVHTNAPRHWPAVHLDQFEIPSLNLIAVAGQLAQLHTPPGSTIALMRDFLYEDGILQVPVVVEEGSNKTCVFVYSNHDRDAAAHFSGARRLLKSRENAGAVYYGPQPIAPAAPGEVLKPIDTPMFSKPASAPRDGTFALWWATEEDPLLSRSPDCALLDRWFEALDGYGHLLLTAFANDLDLVEKKQKIDALPDQPFLQPLRGPGDTDVLLHASAPEGIFLAFDAKTSVKSRRIWLTLLSSFASQYRVAIENHKIPRRAEEKGLQTWTSIRDKALAKESEGQTGLTVHAISLRDGQPARSPSATSAEERSHQPGIPTADELDFAMDLVDRVVARLKTRAVVQSSQEALGQPNQCPVIAVRAGGHVWERQLRDEDAPAAQAAAGRVLGDWPDAEVVAVLVDAAIRENGVRTDVLDVRIENRSGVAADLIQRYTTSASGDLELVGRPTAMPVDPFLLPPTAQPASRVEQALAILAAQALEQIVQRLTIAEPSGILGDDATAPLTSPSALLGHADKPPTLVRFMLQGPVTAAMSCAESVERDPPDWVVFFVDDLVTKDDAPDRRLRLCVQRRTDSAAAIFDQHYDEPVKGTPLTLRGDLEYKRSGGSFFPER